MNIQKRSEVLFTAFRLKCFACIFGLFFLVQGGCVTTGPGGKQSLILLPETTEISIGQGMAEELKKSEKRLDDEVWQKYLTEVGSRIVAVCDRQNIEYTFTVIESDQANAFAAPGGFVYFYTGLLREMKSESEMAAVMAHEISHVVARHGAKRLQTAIGASILSELVLGNGSSELINAAVGVGMSFAMAGYSREAEREADTFGIEYMKRAGYNPNGAVSMFETLARLGGSRQGVFENMLSSHPETQERIQNAKNQIAGMSLTGKETVGEDRYLQMVRRLPKTAGK